MSRNVVPGAAFNQCSAPESQRGAALSMTGRRLRESLSAARRGEEI